MSIEATYEQTSEATQAGTPWAAVICMTLLTFLLVGLEYGLGYWFVGGLLVAAGCAAYHYTLIRERDRMRCFAAFRHNNWLGAAIFAGVALDYAMR